MMLFFCGQHKSFPAHHFPLWWRLFYPVLVFCPHRSFPVGENSLWWTLFARSPLLASRMHRSFPVGHKTLVSALLATFSSGLCLKAPDNSGAA